MMSSGVLISARLLSRDKAWMQQVSAFPRPLGRGAPFLVVFPEQVAQRQVGSVFPSQTGTDRLVVPQGVVVHLALPRLHLLARSRNTSVSALVNCII